MLDIPIWNESGVRLSNEILVKYNKYESYGEDSLRKRYLFRDRNLERWFDSTREEINSVYASVCNDVGLPSKQFHWIDYRW